MVKTNILTPRTRYNKEPLSKHFRGCFWQLANLTNGEPCNSGKLMTEQNLSLEDIKSCQKVIFDFLPPPVTESQRESLEKYQNGELQASDADTALSGTYESCLYSLISAEKDDDLSIQRLHSAAEIAIKYAGAADGSALYAKLNEICPEHFSQTS